jgi:hypothetical protein
MNAKTTVRKAFQSSILLLLAAVLAFVSAPAIAQSGAGSIQGTVKDSTGAIIPGAIIHVVNTATHVAYDTKSNSTGFYQAPGLFTGRYALTVTAPGMKTYKTSIELLVAQNAVIDPMLPAGSVSQTVEVNADTVQMVTKDSAAIESTLENARIQQLPENTRDITTLLNIATPGLEGGGQTLNGGDPEALSFVIDGAPTQNNNQGGIPQTAVELIDPDSIQEVRVETSNSSAQYATPGTAVISTKSGTNKIHGSFFETARNNAFGVARNEQDPVNTPAPQYIRNEFGFSAGGPVYIPKVYDGRNRTFWFASYERYSLANESSSRTAVPTLAMRSGNFGGVTNAKLVPQIIYDPATTTPTAAGQCSAAGVTLATGYCRSVANYNGQTGAFDLARESPLATAVYAMTPLPNTSDNPFKTGNLVSTAPNYQVTPKETIRVDQVFNQNNRVYVRYTHQANTINTSNTPQSVAYTIPNGGGTIPTGAAQGYVNVPSTSYNASLGFTHIFSPSFFSETIVSQQWYSITHLAGVNPNQNYEQMLNLPNNFGETGFPNISGILNSFPGSQSGNAHQVQRNFLADENLTKIHGHHQVIFGGRFTHLFSSNKPIGAADNINFGANSTAVYDPTSDLNYNAEPNTGNADAALFLGSPGKYVVNLQAPRVTYHQYEVSLYVQDNFHVTDRLTLNLGLRYEAHPALYTENGLMNSFDLKNDAVVLASTPAQLIAKGYTNADTIAADQFLGINFETPQEAGMPANTLLNNYNLNFLPRLGAAYVLNRSPRSPILRGGYGIYLYDTPLEDFVNHQENQNPFQNTYTQSYSTAAQSIDGLPTELLRYNDPVQFGVAGTAATANVVKTTSGNPITGANVSILPGGPTAFWSDSPAWRPARVQQFNATLELPLPGRSAFRMSYVGSKSTNLDISEAYNNTPSVYQWEAQTGAIPPTGGASVLGKTNQNTYSTVATNPYDNRVYGGNTYHTKDGWANYNSLQMNYQRLYHSGSAFQVSYVWAKAMRAGGDAGTAAAGQVDADANYPGVLGTAGVVSTISPGVKPYAGVAPPTRPSGLAPWQTWHDMIRFQLYQLDNSIPAHHVKFNGIYDIPVGRGKRFMSNAPKWLNEIVGGFQIAGNGDVVSQSFQPGDGDWGPIAPLKIYKKSKPVRDCSSGVCYNNFLWYNGYIQPQLNPLDPNHDNSSVAGKKSSCETVGNCITGLPADFVSYQTSSHNVPSDTNFNTDKVSVALLSGKSATATYDAGPKSANYTSKMFLPGPYNWVANASIFKVFPIRDGMFLRVNLDAFNVFNMPGENNPGADGIEAYLNSHEPARQLQITARFTF